VPEAPARYAGLMPNVGPLELVVILAIALIVLGPKKLPEVGRSIGKGMREFKDSLNGDSDRDDEDERPALKTE
jgi:sec-independent protein translocase protein TatA